MTPQAFLESYPQLDADAQRLSQLALEGKILTLLKPGQFKSILRLSRKGFPVPSHLAPPDYTAVPKRGAVPHLSIPLRKRGGRNHHGRITVRHRGGGFKRRIRCLDRHRVRIKVPQKVIRIEHDPNRSSKIALLQEQSPQATLSYILPPVGLQAGDILANDGTAQVGHTLPLSDIPVGTFIYNIETKPGSGGKLVRSAGTRATLLSSSSSPTEEYVTILMPSGAKKTLLKYCTASIGQVGNTEWHHRIIGKAGRNRNLGKRPTVRGVAMNPVDHPHGGGKGGRSKGHHSQSPWGKICK